MNPIRHIETQCTHADFLRHLPTAVDYSPFEIVGNQVIVHNETGKIYITMHSEPIRNLGSLKLPMENIKFEFDGHSDHTADAFMDNYRQHTLRAGGG